MTKANDLTRPELAEALGVDTRTVNKWIQSGMPVALRGKGGEPSRYDVAAVQRWKQDRDERARAKSTGLMAARERKELAQAAEAEQRVALRAGKLIPVEDVEKTWTSMVAAARARLLALPTALTDRVCRLAVTEGPAAVEAALQKAVYDALRELAADEEPAPKPRRSRRPAKRARRKPRGRA